MEEEEEQKHLSNNLIKNSVFVFSQKDKYLVSHSFFINVKLQKHYEDWIKKIIEKSKTWLDDAGLHPKYHEKVIKALNYNNIFDQNNTIEIYQNLHYYFVLILPLPKNQQIKIKFFNVQKDGVYLKYFDSIKFKICHNNSGFYFAIFEAIQSYNELKLWTSPRSSTLVFKK